jgi:VWFA-related protein
MVARFAVRATVLLMITVVVLPAAAQETPTPFGETIEVRRILTEVRVVDFRGNPVPGLEPGDFRVKIDGKPAEVASVLWFPSSAAADDLPEKGIHGKDRTRNVELHPKERTIVFLFQIDIALRASRTEGLYRMAPQAAEFIRGLSQGDRVALLTFDSHLRLDSDFTEDHDAFSEMLTTTNILNSRGQPLRPSPPLLGDALDPEDAKRAADLSRGLELIGNALYGMPGTKSLVLFGFGLGTMSAGPRITIDDGYERAVTALARSKTSVFSLDLTDADYHSLELGLRSVSEDTGGFYIRTHLFPEFAMDRLARVVSSYYELEIIPPPHVGEDFTIKVKVDRPKVEVYVRQYRPSESPR